MVGGTIDALGERITERNVGEDGELHINVRKTQITASAVEDWKQSNKTRAMSK